MSQDRDDYDDRPSPRTPEPHRGTLILVLGVVAVFACWPLGIAVWRMGKRDLERMRRGLMDDRGDSPTRTGCVLGMVASILFIVGLVGSLPLIVLLVAMQGLQG